MSKVINLTRARKERSRVDKAARGDANAVKFGRSKAQRQAEDAARNKAERDLDGKKREE